MEPQKQDIYGGEDPRNIAAYGVAEAAKYLKIPPTTLKPWVAGRQYPRQKDTGFFPRLIVTPEDHPPRLSFNNLIEAYVLRALRTTHAIPIGKVREAIDFAQERCQVERLLLNSALRASAGELFLERYGELIHLTRSDQLVIKEVFKAHLARIEWDKDMPIRLYPFPTGSPKDDRRGIVIDARRAFGRPILASRSISTVVIVDRIDAEETTEVIAADYGLTRDEIQVALEYEKAA
jgi:uncharacterized protein (DUF433 family)